MADLESLLQPGPVDYGFKFRYFFTKTEINVALEFYLLSQEDLFLNSVVSKIC